MAGMLNQVGTMAYMAAASSVRPVYQLAPVHKTPEDVSTPAAQAQLRDEVLKERGADPAVLYQLSAQARIQLEASTDAEVAMRVAQARAREMATFIDLRV